MEPQHRRPRVRAGRSASGGAGASEAVTPSGGQRWLSGGWITRLGAALLLATTGCGELLATAGVPSLHEWSPSKAVETLERGEGQLVQAGPSARFRALGLVAPLVRLDADQDVPPDLLAFDGWLLVLADDREGAFGAAARLSRAGAPRVAIVNGDLERLAFARLARPVSPNPGTGIEDRTP